ncbi:hypothetical protein Ait01nite_001480 [Actinoplanes italicus]|nr:hypothetical protein Ait01nite_001480 [Actinoplanes italicus]
MIIQSRAAAVTHSPGDRRDAVALFRGRWRAARPGKEGQVETFAGSGKDAHSRRRCGPEVRAGNRRGRRSAVNRSPDVGYGVPEADRDRPGEVGFSVHAAAGVALNAGPGR